jgi:hypothetical protein
MFVNVLHGPDLVFILGDLSLAFIADVEGVGTTRFGGFKSGQKYRWSCRNCLIPSCTIYFLVANTAA